PVAVSCAPPTPSGPSRVTSERAPSCVQCRFALKPSLPAATATRPRSWKCVSDCSCGRLTSQLAEGGGAGGSVRQPASTATAAAPSRSPLLRIGNEPLDSRFKWLGIRFAGERCRPHAAGIGLLAAHPQGLAPVGGDLGVVTERISVRQRRGSAPGITL